MKNQEKSLKSLAKIAMRRMKHKDMLMPEVYGYKEEDNILAEKILTILKTNRDTPTPIKELIDYKKFNNFSPLQREIYIFDLIDKYNSYKQWYEKQEMQNMVI